MQTSATGGWLFQELYASICRDTLQEPAGTPAHQRKVLEEFADSEAFMRKGPRVALRRWFSWSQGATFHGRVWNSRLLSILYIGARLGVYKDKSAMPLWGGQGAAPPPAEDSEDDAAATDKTAVVAVVAAASSSAAEPPPEEGQERPV